MWIALDANAQLRRRKRNDQDTGKPKTRSYFAADSLHAKYEDVKVAQVKKSCQSEIKAANPSLTNKIQPNFHETGVAGSSCARHTIPLAFTNMVESGEK